MRYYPINLHVVQRDRRGEWTYQFSKAEQDFIETQVRAACASSAHQLPHTHLHIDDIETNSPLGDKVMAAALKISMPALEERIREWKSDLLHGRGFMLVRGAPTSRMTSFERAAFFLYIGNEIGDPVTQNKVRKGIIQCRVDYDSMMKCSESLFREQVLFY